MRARLLPALAMSAVLAVPLAACSSSSTDASSAPSPSLPSPSLSAACAWYDVTEQGVTVQRTDGGAPTVTIAPGTPQATTLTAVDLCPGTGPGATLEDQITVDYWGGTLATGQPFDSTFGSSPLTLPLAVAIDGWQQGLAGMQVGGSRLLIVPAELAYGDSAADVGAPSGTLVFVVDLLALS